MTADDLIAQGGQVQAYCPSCRAWRKVRLRRLFPSKRAVPIVRVASKLRCVVCNQAPDELRMADRMNRATLRL